MGIGMGIGMVDALDAGGRFGIEALAGLCTTFGWWAARGRGPLGRSPSCGILDRLSGDEDGDDEEPGLRSSLRLGDTGLGGSNSSFGGEPAINGKCACDCFGVASGVEFPER